MAATTEEIPRDAWRSYFDQFSKLLGTMEATVEVTGPDLGDQFLGEHLVLTGLTYDQKDDVFVIGLDAPGGPPEDLEHLVEHPQRIFVATGADAGMEMAIDIEDDQDHRTILRLEHAPELPAPE
ncbi:MAG: hypothetical protein QOE86_2603 [Solirubrobacteraceae bacterium]|jgi:hypothetical protein|nr:hypothetical protein [Solirubrobacteraceae bacterium]